MTLSDINAIAPILTAVVIAATAVAALVQLRHMRASNHITAMWSVHQTFSDPQYQDAQKLVRESLARMLADQQFCEFASETIQGKSPPNAPPEYVTTVRAATLIGNTFEALGNMIIMGLVDIQIFMRAYAWIIDGMWRQMEPYVQLIRRAEQGDGLYEDFEYLTVCARDWIKRHPVSYPRGYSRILPSFAHHDEASPVRQPGA